MKKIFSLSIMSLLLASTLTGCQYKEFDDYAGMLGVEVIADYSNSGCVKKPVITSTVFYPLTGVSEPFVYDVKDTAIVDLPQGIYRVFAYNNDSEINLTRGFDKANGCPVIYTGRADARGLYRTDSLDHTAYYDYPDVTYSYYGETSIKGVPNEASSTLNRVLMPMTRITRAVDVTVLGMKSTSYIQSIRFSIDGVKRDYSPFLGYNNTYSNIAADGRVGLNDTVKCNFNVFGFDNNGHTMTLHINAGQYHKLLRYDVSKQIASQKDGMEPIKIVINADFDIRDLVPDQHLFDVSVDEWEDEIIPISM